MKRFLMHALAAAVLVTGIAAIPACNGARDDAVNLLGKNPNRGFMHKTLVRGDRNRNYGLFIPNIQSARYPVIIFLHGVGEGGSDATKNLRVGLGPFVADRQSDFPFICIFPQSESGGWDENSEAATDVIAILDDVSKNYPVDPDRVILTGLSTGGYGTYAIGAKYKDRFAALVPMGSNASASKWAQDLVDMPIHAYCNGGDMFGGFGGNDRGMVERIKSLGGKLQEFTQTNDPGHDCWDRVYSEGDLFAWLLQQRRHSSRPAAAPMPAAVQPRATASVIAPAPRVIAAPAPGARSNTSASINTPY